MQNLEVTNKKRTFYRSNNKAGNIYHLKRVPNLRLTWASLQYEFNQFQ